MRKQNMRKPINANVGANQLRTREPAQEGWLDATKLVGPRKISLAARENPEGENLDTLDFSGVQLIFT